MIVRRRISYLGVTVTVIAREENFDVMVSLEPGTQICNVKSTKKRPTYFNAKFKNVNPKKRNVPDEGIYGTLGQQNYPIQNLMGNYRRDMTLSNGIVCTISLRPELYLSKTLMETYRKKKAQSEEKKKAKRRKKQEEKLALDFCQSLNRRSSTRINCKGPIMYSKTNIARPYQGGKCSPK